MSSAARSGRPPPQCRDPLPPPRREEEENSDDESSSGSNTTKSEYGSSAAADEDKEELLDLAERIEGAKLVDEGEDEEGGAEAKKGSARGEAGKEEEPDEENNEAAPTLRSVARWIREGRVRNVVVLSGAGVSCSAGIPDFRSPGTGLYDNLQKYNLPFPEAIFDLNFYRRNTDPFVSLASEIWPGLRFSPTLTHSFVALLERRGVLLRNYTQNIDGLELLGGVSEDRIVECHGHFRSAKCVNCFGPYDGDACRREMVDERRAPRCGRCGGPVKPDIVFFGEGLPDRFGRLLRRDLEAADMIVVMGTSLTVAPVSMIPEMVNPDCRRVLLNRELVGDFCGEGYYARERPDVFEEGDCDESVLRLCRMLGWEDELLELNDASRLESGQQ